MELMPFQVLLIFDHSTSKTASQFHVSLPAVNRYKQHVRQAREAQ
jgi:hypothetical protein